MSYVIEEIDTQAVTDFYTELCSCTNNETENKIWQSVYLSTVIDNYILAVLFVKYSQVKQFVWWSSSFLHGFSETMKLM